MPKRLSALQEKWSVCDMVNDSLRFKLHSAACDAMTPSIHKNQIYQIQHCLQRRSRVTEFIDHIFNNLISINSSAGKAV